MYEVNKALNYGNRKLESRGISARLCRHISRVAMFPLSRRQDKANWFNFSHCTVCVWFFKTRWTRWHLLYLYRCNSTMMRDQVTALQRKGVAAVCLGAETTPEQIATILKGRYNLLFGTPESILRSYRSIFRCDCMNQKRSRTSWVCASKNRNMFRSTVKKHRK